MNYERMIELLMNHVQNQWRMKGIIGMKKNKKYEQQQQQQQQ